jgi:CheY-like chemotaxis protein
VRDSPILVVHPDRKAQRIVQRILGATGYRIDVADDLAHATRLVEQAAPRLVVIDATATMSPDSDAFFAELAARGTEACMTLIGGGMYSQVPHIVGTGAVTNLLVHPMPVLAEELVITAQKLMRGDLFGAEKYLLWGTELHGATITRASQRARVAQALSEAVRSRGQSDRVASMAMLAADELLSNAVHNAPVDADGVHYRKDTPRDIELELDDRHRVYLRWGCDARYLAIEVRDNFGSLDRDTILEALASHDVREHTGGAGMGISLVYRSCDHLVFNLAPGTRTEIIALIDVRHSPAERVLASSYNVFVERA